MKEKTKRTEFAEKIIDLRLAKGFNAKQAAEELGIDYQNYRKYETVILPKAEVYIKIADYYNVSVDFLMGRKGSAAASDAEPGNYMDERKNITVRQRRKEYNVVSNNLGALSDFEIMAIKKFRSISSEDRTDVAKYLNSKEDIN
ncbi:MAG: helix-turn-helix domain-containing protein [Eubacterium sp.]